MQQEIHLLQLKISTSRANQRSQADSTTPAADCNAGQPQCYRKTE
jgi:hypothetical protein